MLAIFKALLPIRSHASLAGSKFDYNQPHQALLLCLKYSTRRTPIFLSSPSLKLALIISRSLLSREDIFIQIRRIRQLPLPVNNHQRRESQLAALSCRPPVGFWLATGGETLMSSAGRVRAAHPNVGACMLLRRPNVR